MIRRLASATILTCFACVLLATPPRPVAQVRPAVTADRSWWPCFVADYPCEEEG